MTRYGFISVFLIRAGLLLALLCSVPAATVCAEARPTEYQVKAAFLFNFARFVEWPESAFPGPNAPFVFCILGNDPFGGDIDAVAGRTVNNRKAQVRRIPSPGEGGGCHLLFISRSAEERIGAGVAALGESTTLVVGETAGFAARGGAINFIIRNNTVGFEINVDAAERAGLRFPSRLLNMAIIVHDRPSGGE